MPVDDDRPDDGLADDEVREFAAVFHDPAAAGRLLDQAGFPAGRRPWTSSTPEGYWFSVAAAVRDGIVPNGRSRLLTAAHRMYPANSVFARGGPLLLEDGLATPAGRARRTTPRAWNVPGRLARFVGRDALLTDVHARLTGGARVALVALDGMGGVGKTSLAIEYAHRHADEFDVVWWVPAERADLVETNLAGLAEPLGLTAGSDAEAVWAALGRVASWLVIFDNVEDVEDVARFQPSGGGRVLVTSRRRAARELGVAVPVTTFARSASLELLRARVPGIDPVAADDVAELVGDLPLAVAQAAGYLDETETPAAEYARLLADQPEEVFPRQRHEVANPWQLSVDRLRVEQPAAVELLELCAWCAPDPVPLGLFTAAAARPGEGPLAAALASGGRAWIDAVGTLVGYHLVQRDGDVLVTHRLVAAAARQAMPRERADDRLATLAALLHAVLPEETWSRPAGRPTWSQLLPHVLAVVERARGRREQAFDDVSWLADRAATRLQELGLLTSAIALFEKTLADRRRVLGPDHHETLTSGNNLALVYYEAGRLDDAIGLHERTLADRERTLGPNHRHVLTSRSNLAAAYQWAGRLDDAIRLHEQALADRERILGPHHPRTMNSRNNLALAYGSAGRLDDAIRLHQQALADRERTLGPGHPETLNSRGDLAGAYQAAGRLDDAIREYQRALADREHAFGSHTPRTLDSRNDLALACQAAGRLDEAVGLFQRTLADAQHVLDTSHPRVTVYRTNLERALEGTRRPEA